MSKFCKPSVHKKHHLIAALLSTKLIVAMVIGLGLTYVWQVNRLSTGGYQIRSMEKKLSELKSVNKAMANDYARLSSMGELQYRIEQLAFVPVEKIEYLTPSNQLAHK